MPYSYKKIGLLAVLLTSSVLLTQCAGMPGGGMPGIPSLSKALSRDAVTTSIKDAETELPYMDDFTPQSASSLTSLPRTETGGFTLQRPGFYSMNAQSYCLHAGTYAPGGGDGYIYAPLKGARAKIIGDIFKRSVAHPEIDQRSIQVLVWAICSKTKIYEMSPTELITANKLLTKTELALLNDVVVEEQLQKALSDKIPPEVRRVMEAESKMRQMLTTGQTAYRDLERVAVLTGAAPWGPGSRKTPEGRWSFHPDGYFVRYRPQGYSKTKIDVYAPECIRIERDDLGRIVLIEDRNGNRIQTAYVEQAQAVPGDSGIEGYAFGSIRVTAKGGRNTSLSNKGWTFTGTPSGGGKPGAASGVFSDMSPRYAWAVNWAKSNASIMEGKSTLGSLSSMLKSKKGRDTLMDLAHYEYGLQQAGALRYTDLVRKAWLYEVCVRKGTCPEVCRDKPRDEPKPFDPSDSVATPGNTSRQRLGTSARVYK